MGGLLSLVPDSQTGQQYDATWSRKEGTSPYPTPQTLLHINFLNARNCDLTGGSCFDFDSNMAGITFEELIVHVDI